MDRVLLDTDVLSEILKGRDQEIVRRGFNYALAHGRFTYTSVSVLEILYGLNFKDAHRQLAQAEASFAENEVILPELEDYKLAGKIRGLARRSGLQLTSDDCLIGAVAFRMGLPVATGNIAHFEGMRQSGLDIQLQNWRKQ